MKKTVLITGAYGFIGRYTALEYHNNGYRVIGIGHGNWNGHEYQAWGIHTWHPCDVSIQNLITYAQNPDVIVHCAGSGSVKFSIDYPMQDFERNVGSIQYILEYIRTCSPDSKLIYPSSAAVYGTVNTLPIKEKSLLNPISPYGMHKKIAEELCQMYGKQYGVASVIVRLFSVYGNGLKKQLLWDACEKLKNHNNVFWGTGQETRDWIHVTDVAKLLYEAADHTNSICPIVNGAVGESVSIGAVLNHLFHHFGSSEKPNFGGEVNKGNPIHYVADMNQIKQWGWKPEVSLWSGLKEYVEWYKEGRDD